MVAAAGKRFAFLKASDGIIGTDGSMFVDTSYPTNRAGAEAVGILVGAYHFARPDATPGDAIAEADHFVEHRRRPPAGDLLPVLDLEVAGPTGLPALSVASPPGLGPDVPGPRPRAHGRPRRHLRLAFVLVQVTWATRHSFALNGYPVLWIAHWTTAPRSDHARGPTGVARAGRSGSTPRPAPCPGSAAAWTSTATGTRTSRPSCVTPAR